MYDLVLVKVVHTSGDLLGPLHQLLRMNLLAVPEEVEESAVRAVLHHDTEHGGLDTNSPERDNDDRKSFTDLQFTHLNWTMLGWLSFLKCLMSVSYSSFTFFTARTSVW